MVLDVAQESRHCLVIGARGFLGRRIEDRLRNAGIEVTGTTRALSEGDPDSWIQYEFPNDQIEDRIKNLRFDYVIVAARLAGTSFTGATDGPPCSVEPFVTSCDRLFSQLNRSGARRAAPRITYISSDAVFSGIQGRYLETDEPDASDAYGSMHCAAERSIKANALNHLIVRTSLMFDVDEFHGDKRLSRMYEALTSKTEFFADTNVFKSPVPVVDIAGTVVHRTRLGQTGIAHVPGERKSVYGFFEGCIEPLGLNEFREHLVARENRRATDTSLRSIFAQEIS
jgi:dTDP-4-dehydrorhamnose reductase